MDFEIAHLGSRRLRQNQWIRDLVAEHRVSVDQMIQPIFVAEGTSEAQEISGMRGVYRETPESLLKTIENDLEKGVRKFMLFGIPQDKTENHFSFQFAASQIQAIKKRFGDDLFLSADVCLCFSTSHGHCGVLDVERTSVLNSESVHSLADMALAYAQAGVDCVVPSDMMDGRIGVIRQVLNHKGYDKTLILSHAAKFSSKFYGPFRGAGGTAPKGHDNLKDRSTYQLDPRFPRDAYLNSLRDANEGADILMVKPGLPYLDVLSALSKEIQKPWAVYQVSGEYASIELLAQNGLTHGPSAFVETWIAFKRAGASAIVTYGARHASEYLELVS